MQLQKFARVSVWKKKNCVLWSRINKLPPSKHSSWWKRLQDVLKTSFASVLIKTNMFVLALLLQKTSSRRLGQDQYIRLGHTSSRRLQDVFKMSSRRLQDVFKKSCQHFFKTFSRGLQDVLQKRLQDILKSVFKTSSRRLKGVLKRSSRRLPKISSRLFQDVPSS